MNIRFLEFDSIQDYIDFIISRRQMVTVCSDCNKKICLKGIWMKISKDVIIALEVSERAKFALCHECSDKLNKYKEWSKSSWR